MSLSKCAGVAAGVLLIHFEEAQAGRGIVAADGLLCLSAERGHVCGRGLAYHGRANQCVQGRLVIKSALLYAFDWE